MVNLSANILCGDTPLPPAWRRFFPEPFLLRKFCEGHLPVVRFAATCPALYRKQTERVTAALLTGPSAHRHKTDLWTLPRVAALIQNPTGLRYHPGHVWRLLGAIGFSCQRPERRAVGRDERAIRRWRRVDWPASKRSASAKANHRLH